MTIACAKNVKELLEETLCVFDKSINDHEFLEIDGVEDLEKGLLKIINHKLQCAFEMEIGTLVSTPIDTIIEVLETGIFQHLQGITRIVGYFSRIHNWNESKIGELNNRHEGNYAVV